MTDPFIESLQLPYLVWFVVVIASVGIILRWKWNHAEKMSKKQTGSNKPSKDIDESIDKLVRDAPTTLQNIRKEIAILESKGATPEQLKSLKQKEQMLDYAATYGDIGKEFVKPILHGVRNIFTKWGG